MIKFIVINENILAYVRPNEAPFTAQILASSVIRGASCCRLGGSYPLHVGGKYQRPATRADFNEFRICTKGYENDPAYDFPKE